MIFVIAALAIVMFIVMFVCMHKEKDLSGFYSELGLFGRWYAFFTIDLLLCGIGSVIALPVMLVLSFTGVLGETFASEVLPVLSLTLVCTAVIGLGIGLLMFKRVCKKCPGTLRKRILWDMIIIFLGANIRLGLIFFALIFAWWLATGTPTTYTTSDGKTVYKYPGSDDLYDRDGWPVGKMTDESHAVLR